jgi:hypothetical protein
MAALALKSLEIIQLIREIGCFNAERRSEADTLSALRSAARLA